MMSGWLWSLTPMYWVTVEPQDGQNWDPAGDDRGRFAHRTVIRGCVNRHNMSVTRRFDGLRWPSGLRTLAWTCTCLSQSIHPPVGPLGDRFLVKPAPFSPVPRQDPSMSVESPVECPVPNHRLLHPQGPTRCCIWPIQHRIRAYDRHK